MELALAESNEMRNDVIKLKHQQEEVDKTIVMLKEKLETESRASEKRRQLLSLLGPKSHENQVKVNSEGKSYVSLHQLFIAFLFKLSPTINHVIAWGDSWKNQIKNSYPSRYLETKRGRTEWRKYTVKAKSRSDKSWMWTVWEWTASF